MVTHFSCGTFIGKLVFLYVDDDDMIIVHGVLLMLTNNLLGLTVYNVAVLLVSDSFTKCL